MWTSEKMRLVVMSCHELFFHWSIRGVYTLIWSNAAEEDSFEIRCKRRKRRRFTRYKSTFAVEERSRGLYFLQVITAWTQSDQWLSRRSLCEWRFPELFQKYRCEILLEDKQKRTGRNFEPTEWRKIVWKIDRGRWDNSLWAKHITKGTE